MRDVKLLGASTKEKFGNIEKILTRIIGQIPQVITAQVPPVPLSFFVATPDEMGVVARFIFPVQGAITQAAVHVANPGQVKSLELETALYSGKSSIIEPLSLSGVSQVMALNIPVNAGTMLQVRCEQAVEQIWIGLLFRPAMDKNEVVRVALEQMEEVNARIHNTI